jgi:hypothetical protein
MSRRPVPFPHRPQAVFRLPLRPQRPRKVWRTSKARVQIPTISQPSVVRFIRKALLHCQVSLLQILLRPRSQQVRQVQSLSLLRSSLPTRRVARVHSWDVKLPTDSQEAATFNDREVRHFLCWLVWSSTCPHHQARQMR